MELKTLGYLCKCTRMRKAVPQKDVAREVKTSAQNICEFEQGRNNSAKILLWYVEHGLSDVLDEYRRGNGVNGCL